MTSASAKVNAAILDQFEKIKQNCDIMTACVSTSFAPINRGTYKSDYFRADHDRSSDTSSPESQRFDSFSKRFHASATALQYPYPLAVTSPETYVPVTSPRFTARLPVSRCHSPSSKSNNIGSPDHKQDGNITRADISDLNQRQRSASSHSDLNCRTASSPDEESRLSKETSFSERDNASSSSPKHNHPLKQRILCSKSETPHHGPSPSSPLSSSPSAFRSRVTENSSKVSGDSSDILRKMYASFGTVNGIKDRFQRFKSPVGDSSRSVADPSRSDRRGVMGCFENQKLLRCSEKDVLASRRTSEAECESEQKRCERAISQKKQMNVHRFSKEPESQINSSAFRSSSKYCMPHGKRNSESSPLRKTPLFYEDVPDSRSGHSLSLESKYKKNEQESIAKHKRSNDVTRKRNSSDDCSSRDHSPHKNRSNCNNGSKRTRYSSSESLDSQVKHPHLDSLQDLHRRNNKEACFVNPLIFPPAAFGVPPAGYPFSFSAFAQANPLGGATNPLLYGANPYLTNPLLLRDMMNQASVASMMSLLPNPTLPMNPGLSLEQLQAIQQIQAASFYHKHLLNSNALSSTPGMLPTIPNPLLHAMVDKVEQTAPAKDFDKYDNDSRKRNFSDKTSSDESQGKYSTTNSANAQKSHDTSSPLSHHRNLSDLKKRRRVLSREEKQMPYPHKDIYIGSKPSDVGELSSHKGSPRDPQATDKPRKQQPLFTRYNLKKKSDKKTNGKLKIRGDSNQKLLPELTSPIKFSKVKEYKDEDEGNTSEDLSIRDGVSSNGKPASYKNLTRERRLVANARERTRVHTISSAFDELRSQIPSYSCNQKLSKLAILRIACEYIRTLSVLAGRDETTTLPQGVDRCTRVLQSESRARSRRKSNKAQIEWEMANYEHHKSSKDDNCSGNEILHSNEHSSKIEKSNGRMREVSSSFSNTFIPDYPTSPASSAVSDDTDDANSSPVYDNDNIVDVESIEDVVELLVKNKKVENRKEKDEDEISTQKFQNEEGIKEDEDHPHEEDNSEICVE